MHCLRLFIVVLQELHCLPNCLHVFMIRLVSEIAKNVYCLRLFYKNYIVYYNVYCGVFIEKYVHTKFRLDWLLLCE